MSVMVPSPASAKSPRGRLRKEWKAPQGPACSFPQNCCGVPSQMSARTHPGSSLPLPQALGKTDLSLRVDTKALQSVTYSLPTLWVSRLLRTRKDYRDLRGFADSPVRSPHSAGETFVRPLHCLLACPGDDLVHPSIHSQDFLPSAGHMSVPLSLLLASGSPLAIFEHS